MRLVMTSGVVVVIVASLLILLCSPSVVDGNSGGLNMPCNVDPLLIPQKMLGTTDRKKAFLPGVEQKDENVVPMWWTLKPDWSDVNDQRNAYTGNPRFTVRSGDGAPADDPTSYVPNQYIDIVIRARNPEQQFAGLLMYAETADKKHVGEWVLPARQSFQIDPISQCVVHKNPDPKHYKNVFRVRFPPGTGTVQIKVLVKIGLAFPELQGAFFWPNTKAQQWLTLTEAPAVQQQVTWIQATVGQSCQQACAAKGSQCDLESMRTISSNAVTFAAAVTKSTSCSAPVMRGCGSFAPTMGTEGCFYHDNQCARGTIKSQYDPCTRPGIAPYDQTKQYDSITANNNGQPRPSCVSYQGSLWCAKQFVNNNNPPNENNWRKVAVCGVSNTAPSLNFPTPTRTAQAIDCTSTKMSTADGARLCACSAAATQPPTTPAPAATPAPGATTVPTEEPTEPTEEPTLEPTLAPTPTPATMDSITLVNPPDMIPQSGTFPLLVSYSAKEARTLAVDILEPSNDYKYWGGGYTNVEAGSSGTVTVTITMKDTPPAGQGYVFNYFIVDQSIHMDGNNTNAWEQAIGGAIKLPVMITTENIIITVPTDAPAATSKPGATPKPGTTQAPTDEPTEEPLDDPTRRPTSRPTLKNSASISSPSLILLLSCLFMGATSTSGSSTRMMIITMMTLLFISTSLPGLHAHNWLTSPSRSNRGTGVNGNFNGWTTPACPTKSPGRVHAQVGAGQRFPMEWASGHGFGSSTYLVVIKAENERMLPSLNEPMMDQYLREAPNNNYMADSKAYHIFPGGGQKLGSLNQQITNVRPANFRPYQTTSTWSKTAAATANDRRAAYTNAKWNWIVSLHKFALQEDRPDDMDGVLMEIPAGSAPGSYIVYYFWRGYYDCMDINVLASQSTDLFGTPSTTNAPPDRILHTAYPGNRPGLQLKGECRAMLEFDVINNNHPCIDECNRNQENTDQPCQAVVVAPMILPSIVKLKSFQNGASHLPQQCNNIVQQSSTRSEKLFVCYPVYGGNAPAVGPPTRTVSDPEDPVFYHTTYVVRKGFTFKDNCGTMCATVKPPTEWRYADKCISCADAATNYLTDIHPTWNFTDNCQHCDASLA